MAVSRPCPRLSCVNSQTSSCCRPTDSDNVMTVKIWWRKLQTQLCTLALCMSLFHSVRLPISATALGPIPVMVTVTVSMVVVALPVIVLQLTAGQLGQQDAVGVWRAVPVFRGIGYIRLITSFLCCVYHMIYVTLAAVYFIWTAKGPIPFKECTKLQITKNGYENIFNASECFNRTFLAPYSESPQYFGFMAIIVFVLWFFTPLLLYGLKKSTKASFVVLAPMAVLIALVLLIRAGRLEEPPVIRWTQFGHSTLWHAAVVQALLSAQITGGYLVSAGGSIYQKSDVRWNAITITFMNIIAGWIWIIFWQAIGSNGAKDTSLISVLVQIYQTTLNDRHGIWFPLLGFSLIFISGIITTLIFLYPVYDKLRRAAGEHWQVTAAASSALGTALTLALLAHGLNYAALFDETIVPALAIFPTIVEVIGFVFIYGWKKLLADIDFLAGVKVSAAWVLGWWLSPIMLLAVSGWHLHWLLETQPLSSFWPLVAVFVGMLAVMLFVAVLVVAKEEQYNFISKVAAAFRPSRLWGPEEPVARYHWMSRQYPSDDRPSLDGGSLASENYQQMFDSSKKIYNNGTKEDYHKRQRVYLNSSPCNIHISKSLYPVNDDTTNYTYTRKFSTNGKNRPNNGSVRYPQAPLVNEGDNLGACGCDRHFSVNLSYVRNGEVTTSL